MAALMSSAVLTGYLSERGGLIRYPESSAVERRDGRSRVVIVAGCSVGPGVEPSRMVLLNALNRVPAA